MTDVIMPDSERIRRVLASIGWEDVRIESVPGGSINHTYRLSDIANVWYLRIGPDEQEVLNGPSWFSGVGLQREQMAINIWSDLAHLFPVTVHTDFSREYLPADWVIQKAIPGESLHATLPKLTTEESDAIWTEFGEIVARMHSYIGQEFGALDVGSGTPRWSETLRWDATGLLTDAHKYNMPIDPFQQLCELIDDQSETIDEITEPHLIHSDLGLRHVLVARDGDDKPHISGILDMEFARFADPMSESIFVDRSMHPGGYPGFNAFLDGYGAERLSRDDRRRTHIYNLIALSWWATDAMRRQRPNLAREALTTMETRLKET